MAHTILVPSKMASKNIDSYVRPALSKQNMDNGYFFSLTGNEVTSGCEVWTVQVPTTGSLTDLWMALEPELPFLASGTNRYNGLGTIQDFYISASLVFTAVKPKLGDIMVVTAEAFVGGSAPTTGQFCYAVDGTFLLTAGAAASAANNMSWKFLGYTYIPSADGSIGSGRITAYKLECVHE
jgi:hypothetical protein